MCLTDCSQVLCCTFDVTCCMLQPTPCAFHALPNYLHAFLMQVRRHLKGQRDIPHQSDQLQVWKQEYKVLLIKTEQRMKDSAHIFTSQTLSDGGAASTPTTSQLAACACSSSALLLISRSAAGAEAC